MRTLIMDARVKPAHDSRAINAEAKKIFAENTSWRNSA
jgi:hypothetical protein